MKNKTIISLISLCLILIVGASQYIKAENGSDDNKIRIYLKNIGTVVYNESDVDSITTSFSNGRAMQHIWHNGESTDYAMDDVDSIRFLKPTLEFATKELDFGRVERGATMHKNLQVTNTSKYPADLIVDEIWGGHFACDSIMKTITIGPGETFDLGFSVNPETDAYKISQRFHVSSDNIAGGETYLHLSCDIIAPISEEVVKGQENSISEIVGNSVDDNFNAAEQIAQHKDEIEKMESVNEVNVGDAATEVTYTNGEHIIYPYSYPSAYEYDGVEEMDSQIDAGKANKAKKAIQKSGLKAVIFNLFDGEKGRTNQNNMVKAAANILDQYYDVTVMEFTGNNVIKAFQDQLVGVVYFSTYGNEEGNKIATKDEPREDGTFVIDGKKYGSMSVNVLKKVTPKTLANSQKRLVYMASCNSMKAISQFSTEVDDRIRTTYVGWDGVNVDGQAYGVVLFDMLLNYEKTLGDFFSEMNSSTLGIKDHQNPSYLTAFPSGDSPTKLGFRLRSSTKKTDYTVYITSPETGMYKELGWFDDGKLNITVKMKRAQPVDFNVIDWAQWKLKDNRDVYESMMFDCLATGFNHSCEDKYDKRFVRTHLEDAAYPPNVSYTVKPGVIRLEVRSYKTNEDYFSSEGYAPIDRRSSEPVYLIINNGFLHNAADLKREVPEPLMVTTGIVAKKLYAVGQIENVVLDNLKTGFEYWEKGSTSKNTVQATNVGSHFIAQLNDVKPNTVYTIRAFTYDYDNNIVYSKETLEINSGDVEGSADADSHEYVDLGLPSGTLWATCNVGANSPEEYGDYFAWGETKPKEVYNWSTYKWCNGSENTITKYCPDSDHGTVDNKTVLELADDAAHVNWGGSWRMPTRAEQDELLEKCTWTWTTQNGNKGYKVTSKTNGNYIFLPAAGYRFGGSLYNVGSYGQFWSSLLHDSYSAYRLHYSPDGLGCYDNNRSFGFSVRPVYNKKQDPQKVTTLEPHYLHVTIPGADKKDLLSLRMNISEELNGKVKYHGYVVSMHPIAEDKDLTSYLKGDGGIFYVEDVIFVKQNNLQVDVDGYVTYTNVNTGAVYRITSQYEKLDDKIYIMAYANTTDGEIIKGNQIEYTPHNPIEAPTKGSFVDLGTSVMWASYNYGGNSPTDYGLYYVNEEAQELSFGNGARLPSIYEWDELEYKKTNNMWLFNEDRSKNGVLFVGSNGNSIFCPLGGVKVGSTVKYAGEGFWYISAESFWGHNVLYEPSQMCDEMTIRLVSDKSSGAKVVKAPRINAFPTNSVPYKISEMNGRPLPGAGSFKHE